MLGLQPLASSPLSSITVAGGTTTTGYVDIPRKWSRQPQVPVQIDWSNPLARGLTVVLSPSFGPKNIAGPETTTFGSPLGTSKTNTPSLIGNHSVRTITQTGTQVGMRVADSPRLQTPEITALTLFRRTGTTDANSDIFAKTYQGNIQPYISWTFNINNSGAPGQNNLRFGTNLSGSSLFLSNPVTLADTTLWNTAVLVRKATAMYGWVNGKLETTNTGIAAMGHGVTGVNDISTSNANIVGVSRNQPFDYAINLVWGRALSDQEVIEISRNPWQIFKPLSRRIWVQVSGITISTIARPSGDVTVTGWSPSAGGSALYDMIDETTASDSDYIYSSDVGTTGPAVFNLSQSLSSGNYVIRFRSKEANGNARLRAVLLDSSNSAVGTSSWQSLTSTYTAYELSVSVVGTATRVSIEVQTD